MSIHLFFWPVFIESLYKMVYIITQMNKKKKRHHYLRYVYTVYVYKGNTRVVSLNLRAIAIGISGDEDKPQL